MPRSWWERGLVGLTLSLVCEGIHPPVSEAPGHRAWSRGQEAGL